MLPVLRLAIQREWQGRQQQRIHTSCSQAAALTLALAGLPSGWPSAGTAARRHMLQPFRRTFVL